MTRIIICTDGTGNEIGDRESNVLKLYKALHIAEGKMVGAIRRLRAPPSCA